MEISSQTRCMKDSLICIDYDFSSNDILRDDYIDIDNGIRIAKMLSDMDAIAGIVAYRHYDRNFSHIIDGLCDAHDDKASEHNIKIYSNFSSLHSKIKSLVQSKQIKLSTLIVTAAVDRIKWMNHPSIHDQLRMYAMVTFVGTSSMEVTICLIKLPLHDESLNLLNIDISMIVSMACFTMAARSMETRGPDPVPRLSSTSTEEIQCYNLSKLRRSRRTESLSKSLSDLIIVDATCNVDHGSICSVTIANELSSLSSSSTDHRTLRDDSDSNGNRGGEPISKCTMRATYFCHPQDKNIHGVMFGGYLMRIAYELCFSNVCAFSDQIPTFISIDEIQFKAPVPTGSILLLESRIVHVDDQESKIHVAAASRISDGVNHSKSLTNTFHFVFQAKRSIKLPDLIPKNEYELALQANCIKRSESNVDDDKHANLLHWSHLLFSIIYDDS